MHVVFAFPPLSGQNALAACVLLALFIGSVVYEVLAIKPHRQWLALLGAILAALLVFFLLTLVLR